MGRFNNSATSFNNCGSGDFNKCDNSLDNTFNASWSPIKDESSYADSATLFEKFAFDLKLEENVTLNNKNMKNNDIDCIDGSSCLSRMPRHNANESSTLKYDINYYKNDSIATNSNENKKVVSNRQLREPYVSNIDVSNSLRRFRTRQPLHVTPTSKRKHLSSDKSIATPSTTSLSVISSSSSLLSYDSNKSIKDKNNILFCKTTGVIISPETQQQNFNCNAKETYLQPNEVDASQDTISNVATKGNKSNEDCNYDKSHKNSKKSKMKKLLKNSSAVAKSKVNYVQHAMVNFFTKRIKGKLISF